MTDAVRSSARHGPGRWVWAAWCSALILLAAILVLVGFYSRDPDSALHTAIVAQSYQRPVSQWIAPNWGGQWGRNDLYREHPAGIFLVPSALARCGYPAEQAPYVVNAVFQILTILLVGRFAAMLIPASEARALTWILLLLPIAFTYRIRANHEQAVLLLTLVALDAAERARRQIWWSPVIAMAVTLTFLVKGVFAFPVLATCAVWLLLRPPAVGRRMTAWGGLLLASVSTGLTAAAYEMAYRRATGGDTFLGYYLPQQLGLAAASTGAFAIQKLTNLAWYGGRLLWFSLPWSLVLIAGLGVAIRRHGSVSGAIRDLRARSGMREIFVPVFAAAILWPLMFSLSDRHADRYIFPAYCLLGAAGAIVGIRRSVRLERAIGVVERLVPFEQVTIWALLTLLTLATWLINLPRVQL
jgi:4-amino-4-deoxy-L-arabinose transferase-like glycosyltransferase